jgi:hypothetical protein
VTIIFEGDSVAALVDDPFRYSQQRNLGEVVFDGEVVSTVALEEKPDTLELLSGLAAGEHTLTMAMRIEPSMGKGMLRAMMTIERRFKTYEDMGEETAHSLEMSKKRGVIRTLRLMQKWARLLRAGSPQ